MTFLSHAEAVLFLAFAVLRTDEIEQICKQNASQRNAEIGRVFRLCEDGEAEKKNARKRQTTLAIKSSLLIV